MRFSRAALFDLAFFLSASRRLSLTAAHLTLAGIAAGLLAAVPGIIDYLYTVPPDSSAKARATRHGAGNVVALLLFGIAFWLRDGAWIATYSPWDSSWSAPRCWGTPDGFATRPDDEIAVAPESDLKDGHMKLLHVNGRRIALARTATGFHAVDDGCTHRGGSLAGRRPDRRHRAVSVARPSVQRDDRQGDLRTR